jgi:hypothetical protein
MINFTILFSILGVLNFLPFSGIFIKKRIFLVAIKFSF